MVTRNGEDRWKFRTPSLRNVAQTAPYMHAGNFKTLAEVVGYYDRGGTPNRLLDSRITPLHLQPDERLALIAFLESLTSVSFTSGLEP